MAFPLLILNADEIGVEYCASRSREAAKFLMRLCASNLYKRQIYLTRSINHFEVTNVGANHDLMQLFEETVPEPETIK